MSDLIRRSDAIEAVFKVGHEHVEEKVIPLGAVTDYSDAIKELPSAEPKTGEWIQKDMYADRFCSKCNYAVWDSEAEEYNFCPNCGAKMYKGGEEE